MARHSLKRISPTCWNITSGREKVGFVRKIAAGGFVGRIGDKQATGGSAEAVFRQVSAEAFGFASPTALRQHNAEVARDNAARHARFMTTELDEILGEDVAKLVRGLVR